VFYFIPFHLLFKVCTVWPQIGLDHAKNNESRKCRVLIGLAPELVVPPNLNTTYLVNEEKNFYKHCRSVAKQA